LYYKITAIIMVAEANIRRDDSRYAVDIRVFVTLIVIAMAISFGVGVGLGPTSTAPIAAFPAATPLPPVTSVQVAEAGDFPVDEILHEPAGQVSDVKLFDCYRGK
jgi:hypothetical protein